MKNTFTGNILTPSHTFEYGTITTADGIITEVSLKGTGEDPSAPHIIPGLVDIHSHGCMGHDTCDGDVDAILAMARFQESQGVTSYFPTTMTLDEERLTAAVRAVAKAAKKTPVIKGIYLEGPFISVKKIGAQNPDFVQKPDIEMLKRLQQHAEGLVRFIALAPEVAGAAEFIKAVKASSDPSINSICLSIAHTAATYDRTVEAIKEGMSHVTHLYNAMPPYNHREPGVIGAVYESKVAAELICDGIHIHPAVIRNTFRMLGSDRICLISDSCEAAGMPDGDYQLGGRPVHKEGRRATMDNGTVIAGSASTLADCLKYCVTTAGIPLADAATAASTTPAREAGIAGSTGMIKEGCKAEIIVFEEL